MQSVTRMNITVPTDFYHELVAKLEPRQMSRFLVTSARKDLKKIKTKKETYAQAMRRLASSISAKNHPEWKDYKSILKWVNEGRSASNRDYSYIPYGNSKD